MEKMENIVWTGSSLDTVENEDRDNDYEKYYTDIISIWVEDMEGLPWSDEIVKFLIRSYLETEYKSLDPEFTEEGYKETIDADLEHALKEVEVKIDEFLGHIDIEFPFDYSESMRQEIMERCQFSE